MAADAQLINRLEQLLHDARILADRLALAQAALTDVCQDLARVQEVQARRSPSKKPRRARGVALGPQPSERLES